MDDISTLVILTKKRSKCMMNIILTTTVSFQSVLWEAVLLMTAEDGGMSTVFVV